MNDLKSHIKSKKNIKLRPSNNNAETNFLVNSSKTASTILLEKNSYQQV